MFGRHSSRLSIRQVPATWKHATRTKKAAPRYVIESTKQIVPRITLVVANCPGQIACCVQFSGRSIRRQLSISVFMESHLHDPSASPSTTSVYGTSHNCNTTKSFVSLFFVHYEDFPGTTALDAMYLAGTGRQKSLEPPYLNPRDIGIHSTF